MVLLTLYQVHSHCTSYKFSSKWLPLLYHGPFGGTMQTCTAPRKWANKKERNKERKKEKKMEYEFWNFCFPQRPFRLHKKSFFEASLPASVAHQKELLMTFLKMTFSFQALHLTCFLSKFRSGARSLQTSVLGTQPPYRRINLKSERITKQPPKGLSTLTASDWTSPCYRRLSIRQSWFLGGSMRRHFKALRSPPTIRIPRGMETVSKRPK